jgi:TRAP-type C4-dicarboxylate transport system permease small subunit
MAGLFWFTEKICRLMTLIAYSALTFIMLLTVADVTGRIFRHPILGTFEIVGMGGAIAIGFAIPLTSWLRGQTYVDFAIQMFPDRIRNIVNILTRVVCIALFAVIGYNLFLYASNLRVSGEVSLTRQIPFYPVAYGLGVSCFVQCLVLITDIAKVLGGKYE